MTTYQDTRTASLSFRLTSSSCFLLLLHMAVLGESPTAAERLGIHCDEVGAFYCADGDPSSFTRCIDHELYLFHCPEGLHFNTLSHTCDWPDNADCGGHGKASHGGQESHGGGWEDSQGGHQNQIVKEESHWDSQAAASGPSSHGALSGGSAHSPGYSSVHSGGGKPWWRPDNVDPKAWEDLNNLVEIPWDGSTPIKSASATGKKGGQASSAAEGKKGGHGHSHGAVVSATGEKRPSLDNIQWHEGPCQQSECKLPNCWCPGVNIPGGLSPKQTPQMVMLTFDDEVSAAYYGYFQRLFRPGRYNPNGCPVRGCLFVSGSGTDYDLVYPLYAMGNEIASHTLSHKFPHTWWASASYQEYVEEVEGMRKALAGEAGIPYEAIKGFRVPFLQVGGDNMYKALYDNKFVYDTSMFTGSVWEGSDPVWPFTLDYSIPEEFCQHDPCPKKQYPGFWEIPVQRWYGIDGHSCAMPDGCTASGDAEEDLEFFRTNFRRYYESNRAPLGIFVHARWFHTEHHLDALDRFIDELLMLDDVYIVTPSQVIEWMKKPSPLDQVKYFKPWSCEGSVSADKRR